MKNDYDYSKLRGLIVEKYKTLTNLSKEIGKSTAWLSSKLCNDGDFSQTDIESMVSLLEIGWADVHLYFFNRKVKLN